MDKSLKRAIDEIMAAANEDHVCVFKEVSGFAGLI